jgi:hypothetical protein
MPWYDRLHCTETNFIGFNINIPKNSTQEKNVQRIKAKWQGESCKLRKAEMFLKNVSTPWKILEWTDLLHGFNSSLHLQILGGHLGIVIIVTVLTLGSCTNYPTNTDPNCSKILEWAD